MLKDEEPGDGLYGWTAPKQYKSQKGNPGSQTVGPIVGLSGHGGAGSGTGLLDSGVEVIEDIGCGAGVLAQ